MVRSAETKPTPSWSGHSRGGPAPGFAVEFVDLERLSQLQPEWRQLLQGARDPNPFLGPDFFLPLIDKVAGERLTGVMALWRRGAPGSSELAAFFPYRIASKFPLTSLPVLEAFAHPFVSDGTPLLRGEDAEGAAAALLGALQDRFAGHVLLLHRLRLDTPTAAALRNAADARGLPIRILQSDQRAAVRAGTPSERYLRGRVNGKKLRELRRCEKRLSEQGQVEMKTLFGDAVASGLKEFLRLEAAGWKGRRGTALASTVATRAFAHAALAGASAPATAIDVLRVDGVTIAAAVHLIAGANAVAFKCAYDESWARVSPGALLDLHTLRLVLDGGRLGLIDSGAVPGHPVEALWCDRVTVGQVAIGLGGACDGSALDSFARRRQAVEGWKAEAKTLMKNLERVRAELRSGRYFGKR